MNFDVKESVKKRIVELYRQNPNAARLFDLNAERSRDAASTSIDAMCRKLEIGRGEAVSLARDLEAAGCGQFKNGRRGAKSRLEWSYSCILLGKAAAGEQVQLEEAENPEDDDDMGSENVRGMSIANAKAAIAAHLGISVAQIEISIKA
jgi:hypothetical protein